MCRCAGLFIGKCVPWWFAAQIIPSPKYQAQHPLAILLDALSPPTPILLQAPVCVRSPCTPHVSMCSHHSAPTKIPVFKMEFKFEASSDANNPPTIPNIRTYT